MCQSEINNVFDLLHVSGYFSHGNGFTRVWLVGTEKNPLSNASENGLSFLSWYTLKK